MPGQTMKSCQTLQISLLSLVQLFFSIFEAVFSDYKLAAVCENLPSGRAPKADFYKPRVMCG